VKLITLALAQLATAAPALAHPGHGPEDTPLVGSIAVAAILGLAWLIAFRRNERAG
jgi:hypothetical protein